MQLFLRMVQRPSGLMASVIVSRAPMRLLLLH